MQAQALRSTHLKMRPGAGMLVAAIGLLAIVSGLFAGGRMAEPAVRDGRPGSSVASDVAAKKKHPPTTTTTQPRHTPHPLTGSSVGLAAPVGHGDAAAQPTPTAPPAGIEKSCPTGFIADGHGGCKRSPARPAPKCPPGQSPDRSGRCVPQRATSH
jgi:hypothetical protein